MASVSVAISYEGKPLSELERLIAARKKWLKESARDAVVATAITVVRSLRADSKQGRKKAKNSDVEVEDTGWVGGWAREGKKLKRVARYSKGGGRVNVFPVNRVGQAYWKGEKVKVYRVRPVFHRDRWTWAKNKNAADKCWYVFAESAKVARDFGKERVSAHMRRWRGLAKLALGFAMAKISTRGGLKEVASPKAKKAAESASKVYTSSSGETFGMVVIDALDYAKKALKSGPGGVDRAMMKAANSIAGRIRKSAGGKLDEVLPIPFPEVVKGRK
jgi:hypothetical protein